MICGSCRDFKHGDCPELKRQADTMITKTDKLGGELCYCHHVIIPREVPEPETILNVPDNRYAACPVRKK